MKKPTRLITAIALLVNAFTSLILFFVTLAKKKSIAAAFAAVAAICGVAGGYLLYEEKLNGALKAPAEGEEGEEEGDDELEITSDELFTREEEAEG